MNIFDLSLTGMVLASIPFLLTLIAAIYWQRALKSTKYGADLSAPGAPKWLRLLTAALYIVTFQVLILVFPRFSWGGVALIVPFLLLFVMVTVWLLFPTRLAGGTADSRRAKIDDFFWRPTPVKRWFVAGNPMCIIHVVRRALGLAVLVLLLLFGAFAEEDNNTTAGKSETSTSNVADNKVPSTVAETKSAAPENVGDKPSASPMPSASPTPTKENKDCDAPAMPEAVNTEESTLAPQAVEVCRDGSWEDWKPDVTLNNEGKASVMFENWTTEGEWGYGRITYGEPKQTAVIRLKLSGINS